MCRRQAGAAHAGQIHCRRFDLHSGGFEGLFLQLGDVLSGRSPRPQALGQLGHRLLGFIRLRLLLGFLGLLGFVAQLFVFLVFFFGFGIRLLGARHE